MAQMLANIRRVVNNDVSNRIIMMNVLFEAITNSIIANANHITCSFITDDHVMQEEGEEIACRRVVAIDVEDDGDGFNEDNFQSFCVYRSDYHEAQGCKGIGRFVFLKIFKLVKYTSWIKSTQTKCSFPFNYDFDKEHLIVEQADVESNRTVLSLSDTTDHCYNPKRQNDKRIDFELQIIKEEILSHLIPTLFWLLAKSYG